LLNTFQNQKKRKS